MTLELNSAQKVAAVEDYLHWREQNDRSGPLLAEAREWGTELEVRELRSAYDDLEEAAADALREIAGSVRELSDTPGWFTRLERLVA